VGSTRSRAGITNRTGFEVASRRRRMPRARQLALPRMRSISWGCRLPTQRSRGLSWRGTQDSARWDSIARFANSSRTGVNRALDSDLRVEHDQGEIALMATAARSRTRQRSREPKARTARREASLLPFFPPLFFFLPTPLTFFFFFCESQI